MRYAITAEKNLLSRCSRDVRQEIWFCYKSIYEGSREEETSIDSSVKVVLVMHAKLSDYRNYLGWIRYGCACKSKEASRKNKCFLDAEFYLEQMSMAYSHNRNWLI